MKKIENKEIKKLKKCIYCGHDNLLHFEDDNRYIGSVCYEAGGSKYIENYYMSYILCRNCHHVMSFNSLIKTSREKKELRYYERY